MSVPGPKTGDAGGGEGDGAAHQITNNNNPGNVLGYVPTHWDRQLPAETGGITKAMEDTKTPAELRTETTSFHSLLVTK